MKDFSAISRLLKTKLTALDNPTADPATQKELERRWPRCAGRAGAWSFPQLFTDGRLVVFTESPIWATELRHHGESIIESLEDLGVIRIELRNIPKLFPASRQPVRNPVLSRENSRIMTSSTKKL